MLRAKSLPEFLEKANTDGMMATMLLQVDGPTWSSILFHSFCWKSPNERCALLSKVNDRVFWDVYVLLTSCLCCLSARGSCRRRVKASRDSNVQSGRTVHHARLPRIMCKNRARGVMLPPLCAWCRLRAFSFCRPLLKCHKVRIFPCRGMGGCGCVCVNSTLFAAEKDPHVRLPFVGCVSGVWGARAVVHLLDDCRPLRREPKK